MAPVPLQAWTQAGKKGVWLKVPLAHAALIAPAVNKGFKFHHAEEVGPLAKGRGGEGHVAGMPCVTQQPHNPPHDAPRPLLLHPPATRSPM